MTRHFGDATFSFQDMWFAGDDDHRICLGGVALNGSLRGDAITVGGVGGRTHVRRDAPFRPPRARKLPMLFVPPRRN